MARDHTTGVRLDDKELELMEEAAEKMGVTVPALLRTAGIAVACKALGREPPMTLQSVVAKLLNEGG